MILGGDLNCRPDDLEAVLLRCALRQLVDVWHALHPDQPGNTSNALHQALRAPACPARMQ